MKSEQTTVYVYKETAAKIRQLKKMPEYKGVAMARIFELMVLAGIKATHGNKKLG